MNIWLSYEDAVAIINRNPNNTFVVQINGEQLYTLKGEAMRLLIRPGDTITYFKEWDF